MGVFVTDDGVAGKGGRQRRVGSNEGEGGQAQIYQKKRVRYLKTRHQKCSKNRKNVFHVHKCVNMRANEKERTLRALANAVHLVENDIAQLFGPRFKRRTHQQRLELRGQRDQHLRECEGEGEKRER